MKITFLASNRDISVGSYRIWVNDLSHYLSAIGIEADIVGHPAAALASQSEVIICAKSDADYIPMLKQVDKSKKIGAINLAADSKLKPDFIIVGSIEEKVSLSHHKNVFLMPLIENMYQAEADYKIHEYKDPIRIGFHGSYSHLGKFQFGLAQALEEYEKERDIELLVVTNSHNWELGRPKIKMIITRKWNHSRVKEDLLSCDIGVVPNITNIGLDVNNLDLSTNLGRYNTDYVTRYKNKSNAGRNFVFHQLGIPVIADLTPSNLHILGNPDCGFVAQNTHSWLAALRSLGSYKKRNDVALAAKLEFDRLYNPHVWARRLFESIKEI